MTWFNLVNLASVVQDFEHLFGVVILIACVEDLVVDHSLNTLLQEEAKANLPGTNQVRKDTSTIFKFVEGSSDLANLAGGYR